MFTRSACLFLALTLVKGQIPSLGYCPDYLPINEFDMNKFLGKWYEAERYFTFTEVASRCVVTDYAKANSGRIYVSNEVTNRLTGVKRIINGNLQLVGKGDLGKLNVKYATSPIPTESTLTVLDTDYDNFAVVWSCTGFGPFHAQNAWLMTRDRLPTGSVLQKAYGILDKFKISRTFFVKTDQEGCAVAASDINAANGITSTSTIQEATGTDQRDGIVEVKSSGLANLDKDEIVLEKLGEITNVVKEQIEENKKTNEYDKERNNKKDKKDEVVKTEDLKGLGVIEEKVVNQHKIIDKATLTENTGNLNKFDLKHIEEIIVKTESIAENKKNITKTEEMNVEMDEEEKMVGKVNGKETMKGEEMFVNKLDGNKNLKKTDNKNENQLTVREDFEKKSENKNKALNIETVQAQNNVSDKNETVEKKDYTKKDYIMNPINSDKFRLILQKQHIILKGYEALPTLDFLATEKPTEINQEKKSSESDESSSSEECAEELNKWETKPEEIEKEEIKPQETKPEKVKLEVTKLEERKHDEFKQKLKQEETKPETGKSDNIDVAMTIAEHIMKIKEKDDVRQKKSSARF